MADFYHVRLEMARAPDTPVGDPGEGYDIVAPLGADGRLDPAAWRAEPDRASARRWRQGFQHARDREPNPEFRRPIPHSPDVRLRVTGARACRVQTALA